MRRLVRHWVFVPICIIAIGSTVFGATHGAQAGVMMAVATGLTLAACWVMS